MIKPRTREELYDLFRQGAIPSGADFADFIKSQLNLLDDGLEISESPDEPIGFRAHGEAENYLDLSDSEGDLRWRISGYDEALTREGLNVIAEGQSKLFIERETGNVGISTDEPNAKLHIIQTSATDAFRIDDAGGDETPLVVTSEGRVGVGTGSPGAQMHLSYSGSGDILRVDDTDSDTTPLIIDDTGNVGIGYSDPQSKLTVAGGMSVGKNYYPGSNNLYVAGNIEVAGTVVFSNGSGVGGIEINAPLTSKTPDITIKDNVIISGDTAQDGSDGNLSVAGDTTLGTYQKVYENQNVVTVNGRIRSGADLQSGEQQYELEVNDVLTVNRNPDASQVKLKGDLLVTGSNTLGDNQGTDCIYLNGTVQRTGELAVTIDDNLSVTKGASIKNALIESLRLNAGATVNEISMDISLASNSNLAIPTEKAVKEYVDNLLAGSVASFTMATPPAGWLECNGQAVSRTDYARLFALIGTRFGAGNGATTFNLPDLRDEFIRGWNHSRALGGKEQSAFQDHHHNFSGTYSSVYSSGHDHWDGTGSTIWTLVKRAHAFFKDKWNYEYDANGRTGWDYHSHGFTPFGTISGASTGNAATETRPQNIALMFCIKY